MAGPTRLVPERCAQGAPGAPERVGAVIDRTNVREMAGPTRLELATSGVTGQRSNQLNYDPAKEWAIQDSNL
jgi:hypothetical protein